ncbi:hypothetical protein Salat_2085500 [Sesamum alatum]|uniref:Uncharacterized protein n=1 Tax=Sesamum alatum TaxID=300844 RepID=A0AAE1Y0C2_9LAMI|nr:hypothetical protein Salat_2085500 [Sesamum alatum]
MVGNWRAAPRAPPVPKAPQVQGALQAGVAAIRAAPQADTVVIRAAENYEEDERNQQEPGDIPAAAVEHTESHYEKTLHSADIDASQERPIHVDLSTGSRRSVRTSTKPAWM